MKKFKKCIISLLLIPTFVLHNFIFAMPVSAEAPLAFGEIKASGAVQIESSTGKWVPLQEIYPLLKTSKIRTDNGIVFITTLEGSRIDLSRDTEVTVDAIAGGYSIKLARGSISFNVRPTSALSIETKESSISVPSQVAGYYSLVAGYAAPALVNVQGMVTRDANGTHIRSISGKISVSGRNFQAKVLDSGENFFASLEGKKGSLGADPSAGSVVNPVLMQAIIIGMFVTGGTLVALEAFRSDGFNSKSGF